MRVVPLDGGGVVHVCEACRAMFVLPRAWSRAFDARDVVSDLEARFAMRSEGGRGDVNPLATCPICGREMDRARFAATSDVVLDACPQGHGVWLDAGALGRAIDYAEHKARIGALAAIDEADAASQREEARAREARAGAVLAEEVKMQKRAKPRRVAAGSLVALLVIAAFVVSALRACRSPHPTHEAPQLRRL
jgi:Zn-finger nucleic acid-binding protein